MAAEGYAGAWWDDAGKAEGGGGVDSKGFLDNIVETGICILV